MPEEAGEGRDPLRAAARWYYNNKILNTLVYAPKRNNLYNRTIDFHTTFCCLPVLWDNNWSKRLVIPKEAYFKINHGRFNLQAFLSKNDESVTYRNEKYGDEKTMFGTNLVII